VESGTAFNSPSRIVLRFIRATSLCELKHRKIVLLADNEMNRDMPMRRLQRKGFEVAIAVERLPGGHEFLGKGR